MWRLTQAIAAPIAASVRVRWSGSVPLGRLLFNDILLYGTAVNVLATLCGLMLFAYKAPTALAVAVHFAPVPYNVFLYAALWRTSAAAPNPWASAARLAGVAWLVLVTVV